MTTYIVKSASGRKSSLFLLRSPRCKYYGSHTKEQSLYLAMIQACHSPACLDHVNGLYGPGAMLGWYLTLAGCIVSWTLHPHRRSNDSIHPDFVAFLVVPLTAAAQVISLSRHAQQTSTTIEGNEAVLEAALQRDLASLQTCQVRAAIEACSKVVWVHLFFTLMVYPLPALRHFKRGSALASVFVICLASQAYTLDHALHDLPGIKRASNFLSRGDTFMSFWSTLVGQDVVAFIQYAFNSRRRVTGPSVVESQAERRSEPPKDLIGSRVTGLALSAMATVIQRAKGWKQKNVPLALPVDFERILFPETPYSLGNIEQIVAAVTGATVLGFNLWSAGNLLCKERQARLRSAETSKPRSRTPESPARRWHGHDHEGEDECSFELHDNSKGNQRREPGVETGEKLRFNSTNAVLVLEQP